MIETAAGQATKTPPGTAPGTVTLFVSGRLPAKMQAAQDNSTTGNSETTLQNCGTSSERTQLQRLGIIMQPSPSDERERLGVLNPAAARSKNGELYLFPRLVASGNYSRIGLSRVRFDRHGNPSGVDRLQPVLEPSAEYELNPATGGGCEDARVTFIPALDRYVMAYTALSSEGPRLAVAISEDAVEWTRLGPVRFRGQAGDVLNSCDNKDGMFFPDPVLAPSGKTALAFLHRPMPRPGQTKFPEHIWLSYCPLSRLSHSLADLLDLEDHHVLLKPREQWETVKLGAGAPPLLTPRGWLLLYHGVSVCRAGDRRPYRYCVGMALLNRYRPWHVSFRSAAPVMQPDLPQEREGIVPDVVFPTGLDQRTDLGQPDRLDVYYGMADYQVGVAALRLPWLAAERQQAKAA